VETPSVDRIGQLISGRYRITSLIGEGGMGAVYLVEHTHMRKRFALKLLHPQMAENKEALARFQREAEAAGHVEHPNIVAATDFGQLEDGAFFLVLEYVDGITLRATLAKGPLPIARALYIARQIALALERAHGAGIVHRDLKPENVMLVTKDDDRDFVKVLDFGVARFDAANGPGGQFLTAAGMVMGTPTYMAPEQAVADRVGHRADLYALGVVLYEMLTGEVPFSGDLLELLTKHVTAPVPPMSERNPEVKIPPPIEAIVRKLLEKEADSRYPSARALVDAIDQVVLELGIEVPWGAPPSSARLAVAAPPASVVVKPPSPSHDDDVLAKTMHVSPVAAPRAGFLGRLDTFRARALVIYRGRIAPRLAPLVARADVQLGRAAARLKLPKAVVIGILGGAVAFFFVLMIVIIAVRGEPVRNEEGGIAGTLASAEEPGQAAPPEEVRAAAIKGPAALEELAVKYPKDRAVARELAFAYDSAGRHTDALRVVRLSVEADPQGYSPDLIRIVSRAASKVDSSDEAFRLLEGPLGARGVDALIELSEANDLPYATTSHAQKSLGKAAVRANATPAAGFILDLRTAATCEDRHDVLVRSGDRADARALPVLHFLEAKSGCGRRQRYDCNPCLRKDDALARAIDAAEAHGRP
jgi:serine/threonine-protein kinase